MAQRQTGPEAVQTFQAALSRNPGSPHLWCDLGDALANAGDNINSRKCYERALQLGPNIPAVQWRAANAYARLGEIPKSLAYMAQILREVSLYDATVFNYYDSTRLGTGYLLGQGIPQDRRAAQAYFRHFLQAGKAADAQQTWMWLVSHSLADETLARDYANMLLRSRQYAVAEQAWISYINSSGAGAAKGNLVFNGGFEKPSSDTDLDWTMHPNEEAEVARDHTIQYEGEWSLRVKFDATGNLKYQGASHKLLIAPGRHRFAAYVRSDGITTDQGLRFRICDVEAPARLDIKTDSITGTSDWRAVQLDFNTSPQTHLIEIQLIRDPSRKFDNQIKGTAWIDDVSVTQQSSSNVVKRLALRKSPESKRTSARSAGHTD